MWQIALSLLLALSVYQSDIKDAKQAREAKNTIVEQKTKVEKSETKKQTSINKERDDKWETYIVTSYTNGYESTQKHKGQKGYAIQANGKRTVEGSSIACPKSMEFGTKVFIKELNHTYVCSDRGSRIIEGHLDIFMEDLDRALDFGRRKMKVKIIKKGE